VGAVKDYPADICFDCGKKLGVFRKGAQVTAWKGKCGWCGKKKNCTAPRDFQWPRWPVVVEL